MDFKDFLIESFNIKILPGIKVPKAANSTGTPIQWFTAKEFNDFMKTIFNNYFHGDLKNCTDRYDIELESVRNNYECIFTFKFVPKGNGQPEIGGEDHPIYKGMPTGWTVYRTPKDAIESIPHDKNLVYRGMSYEEWQFIKREGHIRSKGSYNIGQENLTFYGNAETALYYSNSFAPLQYMASFKKPGVVIAVPRKLVMDHEDRPHKIPGGEFAHEGPLDSSNIASAWMVVPTRSRAGSVDILFDWRREKRDDQGNYSDEFYLTKPREGSRHGPSIGAKIRKMQ